MSPGYHPRSGEATPARVLVVDDSPEDRAAIAWQLGQAQGGSFDVREAGSGREAIRALANGAYDCVLLDYQMPGEDGLAVLDALQDSDGELPCTVVMMTGQGNERIAVQALQRGAEDYISKDLLLTGALSRSIANAVAKRRMRDRLRSHDRDLKMFVERAAHDLRSPAKHIALLADMLLGRSDGASGDPRLDDGLRLIARSSRHLDRLVRGIQFYTGTSRAAPERQQVALDEVLEDVRQVLADPITEAGARIEAEPLPMVWADPDGLAMVLQNLIANAIKFRGPDAPVVRLSAGGDDTAWRVTVADNGIGIPPADRLRIFEPFVRAGDHRAYEGTGLGLATCRLVVSAHGGEIWVDPDTETGATIHFTLPG